MLFAAIAVLLAAIAFVVCLNLHNIYLFAENIGFFRDGIEVTDTQPETFKLTLDEILRDERFTLDQSLMLVNKEYMLSEDFEAEVSEYKDSTVYMNDCILSAYAMLSQAVADETGKKLYVSSSVRTADEQQALYDEDPLTATLPGASEHQTGLSLDVYIAGYAGDGFLKSPAGRFVNSHSWEYGFIMRYPSYGEEITGIRFEPWHIRFVGHPHSDIIYNNKLTLEEYILSLEPGVFYEVEGYFISRQFLTDDALLIPADCDTYVVSPDNTGCYIVTGYRTAEE